MGSLRALDVPLHYPTARRDEFVVDDYHGVKVTDPYRCWVCEIKRYTAKAHLADVGTSLNGTKGLIPTTTLAGNTVDNMRFGAFTLPGPELFPPLDRWVPPTRLDDPVRLSDRGVFVHGDSGRSSDFKAFWVVY